MKFLRKIVWWIQGRCTKCGVIKIDWSGYISSCFVCPLCEMEMDKYKDSDIEVYRNIANEALKQRRKIWQKEKEEYNTSIYGYE